MFLGLMVFALKPSCVKLLNDESLAEIAPEGYAFAPGRIVKALFELNLTVPYTVEAATPPFTPAVGAIVDSATLVDETASEVVLTPVAAARKVIAFALAPNVWDFNPQSAERAVVPNEPTLAAGTVGLEVFNLF